MPYFVHCFPIVGFMAVCSVLIVLYKFVAFVYSCSKALYHNYSVACRTSSVVFILYVFMPCIYYNLVRFDWFDLLWSKFLAVINTWLHFIKDSQSSSLVCSLYIGHCCCLICMACDVRTGLVYWSGILVYEAPRLGPSSSRGGSA